MKMETNKQNVGVAILTPDKIDFKTKDITSDNKGPSNSISGIYSKKPKTLN